MWDLIVKKQMPPLRTARYCCEVLKEGGGEGAFTGDRSAAREESKERANRDFLEIHKKKGAIYLNCDNEEDRRKLEICSLEGKKNIKSHHRLDRGGRSGTLSVSIRCLIAVCMTKAFVGLGASVALWQA